IKGDEKQQALINKIVEAIKSSMSTSTGQEGPLEGKSTDSLYSFIGKTTFDVKRLQSLADLRTYLESTDNSDQVVKWRQQWQDALIDSLSSRIALNPSSLQEILR